SRNEATILLRIPNNGVLGQLISPDARHVMGMDARVGQLWDVTTARKSADLPGKIAGGQSTAVYSTDGRYLAYSTEDHAVHVWDIQAGVEARVLLGHSATVRALAFSRDGKRLASGAAYPDNSARLWSMPAGEEIAVLRGHQNEVCSVAFSPDGSRLTSGSLDQTACLWHAATGRLLATMKG